MARRSFSQWRRDKVEDFNASQLRRREAARDEEIRAANEDNTIITEPARNRHTDTDVVREQRTTRSKKSGLAQGLAIVALLVVLLIAFVSCTSNAVERDNLKGQLSNAAKETQPLKDELKDAKAALDKANADSKTALEKAKADEAAKVKGLQDEIERLKKLPGATPAPAPSGPVGNADGATTPDAATAEAAMREAEANRRLAEQNRWLAEHGYGPNEGWRRNLSDADWANIARKNPGQGVVGRSFARTPEEAAEAAKNNPTVAGTYEQKANPANWVLVYNDACMSYGKDMAFQRPDGTFAYPDANDADFVECGVAVWVNTVSGGQFRLLCDNGIKAAPQKTTKPATFKEIAPNQKLTPPTTTTIVYHQPKYVDRCDVTIKVTVTVTEEAAKDINRYKPVGDIACQPPVIVKYVERCDVTIKVTVTVTEEAAKDINRYKPVGDIACQPPVEECPEGQTPNPDTSSPHKCLEIKDPTQDPAENGNAPDNGTPMPDPGPATPPAVPETEAPDDVVIPAPPAPAPTTPRPADELPTNEGATPAAPVTGTVDETVCEVCGGGMSDTTQVAAATMIEAAPVAATPAAAAPAAVEVSAPAVTASAPVMEAAPASPATSAPAISEPAPTQTQVASVDVTPSDAGAVASSVDTSVG